MLEKKRRNWTANQKKSILKLIQTGAKSEEEVLKNFGIEKSKLDKWWALYKRGKLDNTSVSEVKFTNDKFKIDVEDKKLFVLPLSYLPVVVGLIYFSGFILFAIKVSPWGITLPDLFEVQYFSIGLIPGLFLLFAYLVFYYTWNPDQFTGIIKNKVKNFLSRKYETILVLGIMILAPLTFLSLIPRIFDTIILYVVIYTVVFSYYSIGYISYSIRKRLYESRQMSWRSNFLFRFTWIYLLGIPFFVFLFGGQILEIFPPSLGGNNYITIQLVVDSNSVPIEIICDENCNKSSPDIVYTIPLKLLFVSNAQYVVLCKEKENEHLWVLNSEIVYGTKPLSDDTIPKCKEEN